MLPTEGVARALDDATTLVLPSRSEGMGRVLVEAFCRGRPAVASRVGGIVDLVRDGENGLLVPPQDPQALADALLRVLSDAAVAERPGGRRRRQRGHLGGHAGGVRGAAGGAGRGTTIGACVPTASSRR